MCCERTAAPFGLTYMQCSDDRASFENRMSKFPSYITRLNAKLCLYLLLFRAQHIIPLLLASIPKQAIPNADILNMTFYMHALVGAFVASQCRHRQIMCEQSVFFRQSLPDRWNDNEKKQTEIVSFSKGSNKATQIEDQLYKCNYVVMIFAPKISCSTAPFSIRLFLVVESHAFAFAEVKSALKISPPGYIKWNTNTDMSTCFEVTNTTLRPEFSTYCSVFL